MHLRYVVGSLVPEESNPLVYAAILNGRVGYHNSDAGERSRLDVIQQLEKG
jgi:hypothetical protein